MSASPPVESVPFGESAMRITIPRGIAPRAVLDALRATEGVVDAVVTDTHAAVYFDPRAPVPDGAAVIARLVPDDAAGVVREHRVRVIYDGEDLDEVARLATLTRDDVVRLHAAAVYSVAFVGFMPGFGYLDGLDPRLRLPRRATPRTRVPAGSVAIAGARSGIYPFSSPGGWHLLGRVVDFSAFDLERGATLRAGDRVRFEPA